MFERWTDLQVLTVFSPGTLKDSPVIVSCVREIKGANSFPVMALFGIWCLWCLYFQKMKEKWFAPRGSGCYGCVFCGRQTHRATFVAKFTMAKQAFALLYAWVFLSIIQIFQLIDIVLTFWLSFLHVDVSQHSLNNAYLEKRNKGSINTKCHLIDSIWKPTVARCVFVLTACSRLAVSGWSGGVCLKISFRRRGYLTNRERGMSKKLHKSSFLLKGDSMQRCKKSWTLGSCFFWSSKAFAANWLLQYALYAFNPGSCGGKRELVLTLLQCSAIHVHFKII